MAVVTVSECFEYLGRSFAAGEVSAASVIIAGVVAEAELILGRQIELTGHSLTATVFPTVEHSAVGRLDLSFPRRPVRQISDVTIDGDSAGDEGPATWRRLRDGIALYQWPSEAFTLTLSYLSGLGEPAHGQLKPLILQRACRSLNRRQDDCIGTDTIEVEGYRARYTPEGFTVHEQALLARWGAARSWPR
jgi:hypothetical protein